MARIRGDKFIYLTFLLAFTLLIIVFGVTGLYPFGNRQIMIIDSWHQYYPIFQELHHRITSAESLVYSWNSGGGTNFITMAGYYAMSPLNVLSVFCPDAYLREFFAYGTFVKIALGGAFFATYLRGIFKKNDLSITVFGLLYSFCGFMMGYYWNIMWLDAVALLPLIILGLHKVMDTGKFRLYVLTLSIAVASNFYIGFFLCEFIALYFFILYFLKYDGQGIGHFIGKTFRVVANSILGIALSGVLLLPIVFGMSRAYGQASANPKELEVYYSLLDIINNMLTNIEPTIVEGLPNIRSGILALMFLVIYFVSKTIPVKRKFINGGFLIVLLLVMNINYLDFAFHGFHFPNQVPYRFSFLISFLVLTMAYEAFDGLKKYNQSVISWVSGVGILYMLVAEKLYTELFDYNVFYVSMAFFFVYGAVMVVYKGDKMSRQAMLVTLLVIVMAESALSAYGAASARGGSSRDSYFLQGEGVQQVLKELGEADDDFYRVEMVKKFGSNDPLTYRYRGLAQFASTANSNYSSLTRDLGLPSDAHSNAIGFAASTPALHGMFGIKYLIAKKEDLAMPNEAFKLAFEGTDVKLYENIYSLPFAYMVRPGIEELGLDIKNIFDKQENFYSLATGKQTKFFYEVPVFTEDYDNMELKYHTGIRFNYKPIDASKDNSAGITFEMAETDQAYLYMLDHIDEATVTVHGESKTYKPKRGMTVDLGILEKGDKVSVVLTHTNGKSGYFDLGVVRFDEMAFESATRTLVEQGLKITSFKDTKIVGNVSAEEAGYLYTSIPFEEGWRVKVNGTKVETVAFKEAMLMVPVEAGVSEVEFSYSPKGLIGGSIMTFLAIAIIVLMTLYERKKPVMAEGEADDDELDGKDISHINSGL